MSSCGVSNAQHTEGTAAIMDNRPSAIYQRQLKGTMNACAATKSDPFQRKSKNGALKNSNKGVANHHHDLKEAGVKPLQWKHIEEMQSKGSDVEKPASDVVPVQRKVGFEFQAFDSVSFVNDRGDVTGFGGGKKLGLGDGFKVEYDGGASLSELEIITYAVDETNEGRRRLIAQMRGVVALANEIQDVKDGRTVSTFATDNIIWINQTRNAYFHVKNDSVHFHPQATIGVKFEKIADLVGVLTKSPFMSQGKPLEGERLQRIPFLNRKQALAQKFGWSGKQDQQLFREVWARGLRNAKEQFAGVLGATPKVISFATILNGIAASATSEFDLEHGGVFKYYMPFFFRLGLNPHYSSLNEVEKEVLKRHLPEAIKEASFVLGNWRFNIGEMLNELEEGRDLNQHVYKDDPLKFGMENNDKDIGSSDTEDRREGALIELRKLGNDVRPDQLMSFALAVFDLVRMINTPYQKKAFHHWMEKFRF
ncbi:MAG: hypothetical protein AAF551_00750 [Bacteroidota bacterium]